MMASFTKRHVEVKIEDAKYEDSITHIDNFLYFIFLSFRFNNNSTFVESVYFEAYLVHSCNTSSSSKLFMTCTFT